MEEIRKTGKKYIVVIPARGGSKRLLHKNILPLSGKPLIVHSIDYAKRCGKVDGIYVSTDDAEIKKIAEGNGVDVIQRPDTLSGDHCTTVSALRHVAMTLIEEGIDFEYLILLQATNPLRPLCMLDEALKVIENQNNDSLMTVTPYVGKLGKIVDGRFIPFNYVFGQRSQDMEPLYYENGLLYISKKDLILSGRIMGDRMYPMIVTHPFGEIDIDTEEDFKRAEYYLNTYQNE